jgi:hypothetical protein
MVRKASSASLPNTLAKKKTIAIIGGLDADLIMIANRIPDRGESLLANEYMEALGGKGATIPHHPFDHGTSYKTYQLHLHTTHPI